ncbi:MAG: septum formation initiator family protein [Nitrospinae bacterium]|nr:septum formation initiator family protein [Nitrospinota bacterium]
MESGRRWALFALSAFYFVFLTTASYYKENGFQDIQKLASAIEGINKATIQLEEENVKYANELTQINSSDMYVEAIARENMGLVKPGEIVFEFVDIEKLSPPQHPESSSGNAT